MENQRDDFREHESACARVAAQFPLGWLRLYAGSKLRRDPIYAAAYELFQGSNQPILDVGCGVGLLAFYLRERGSRQPVLGLDVDLRKTRRGTRVAGRYRDVDISCHDIQKSIPAFSGNVALFDVLHYLAPAQQMTLLSHLAKCVAPGGWLVIRDCPRDNNPRYFVTWIAERFGQLILWSWNSSLHFPLRERIAENFSENEFERSSRPLWGTTPFNNQLFIFRRRASETVPVAG